MTDFLVYDGLFYEFVSKESRRQMLGFMMITVDWRSLLYQYRNVTMFKSIILHEAE